jgi:hypothetical protein
MKVKLFSKSSSAEVALQTKSAYLMLSTHKIEPELIDVDTAEGAVEQELYGVMSYPTVVVTTDDGGEVASWHGKVPPAEDIRYTMGHI